MKTSFLKIDFIDESIEMTDEGARDYIGSARIPLQHILARGRFNEDVKIVDEHNVPTGRVSVSITMHDAVKHAELAYYEGSSGNIMQHKRLVDDTVRKIAMNFAQGDFEEVDMYLDMLFMKDNTNMQRVTREMFSDFIMVNMKVPGIMQRDLDIFMRTHELL